jgi:hypothetical protein
MDMSNICVQAMISSVLPHLQFDLFNYMIFKIFISLRKLGLIVTTVIFQFFDNERIRI